MSFNRTWLVLVLASLVAAEDVFISVPYGSKTKDFFPVDSKVNLPTNGQDSYKRNIDIEVPEEKQTQFVSSDDHGRYKYGYEIPEQSHTETRSGNGVVEGSFIFTDPDGNQNKVHYRADASGFRVAANNLPQPAEPVRDTPEVEAAREQHFKNWKAIAESHRSQVYKREIVEEESVTTQVEKAEDSKKTDDAIEEVSADFLLDNDNQAVIISVPSVTNEYEEEYDEEDIEVNAEPIRLLAQLYAKRLEKEKNQEVIPRPDGFRPKNLLTTNADYDLFQRSFKDTVEITNPEYIDLRAFLLTNRFRLQPSTPSRPPAGFKIPPALYNRYYTLPLDNPVVLSRDKVQHIPESLKAVALGLPSIDGKHDAQVSLLQKAQQKDYMLRSRPYPYLYQDLSSLPAIYSIFPY